MNPCIVTYCMQNIAQKTIDLQAAVVNKYNKSEIPFYSMRGHIRHGNFIDYFWKMNGIDIVGLEKISIPENMQMNHDIIIFLDIDCIPLNPDIIDYMIKTADEGKIIGNVQRSGHIENGNHLFVAPSSMAISKETFIKIGKPSAIETNRSDVCEEYTWLAEENKISTQYFIPTKYDNPPIRYDWEKDRRPYWTLENGLPNYGIGTTFGNDEFGDVFYHTYQIFQPGHQEMFWSRCEFELNK